tara:strand:- start:1072 stop:2988 length:1917 start_codon:yes stop_codon:yes gene_type:complete
MSLVITSNTPKNEIGTLTEGINRAFSYTNHLQGTLKIDTDSQIAVQSVKINKTGNIMLNESNTKFGFYFGRKESIYLSLSGYDETDITNNSLMIPAFIVGPEDRDRNFSLNTDDLASQIQTSFRKVLNCPNLCETDSGVGVQNPGPICIPKRDGTGQGFTGFKWTIQETLSASCTAISPTWTNFGETGTGTAPETPGPTFIVKNPNTTEPICAVGTDFPLSLNGGVFNCSLGTHKDGDDYSDFSIGLSRCNGSKSILVADSDGNYGIQEPDYWSDAGTSDVFFDWRVASIYNAATDGGAHEIRVYHSVAKEEDGQFEEVEFEYWNDEEGPRTPYGGQGNDGMTWESEEFNLVRFTINNERMRIDLIGPQGNKIIATGVKGGGDSNGNQTMKPVGPTTRWLFPKLILAPTKQMEVMSYSGVDVKDYVYGSCQDLDWYNQRQCDNDIQECRLLDESLYCGYLSNDTLEVSLLFYNQKGLEGGQFMDNEVRLVSAPSEKYFLGQIGLNSQYILGFQNQGDAAPVSGDLGKAQDTVFESSSVPDLVSKESIFIRVKNLPITSANFSKSAMSNILYHVPTFSNSGAETGSLHFEPNEMVYLNLNNTEPIYISTMEVDLVYGDETLAEGLAGKTVVVFHVRNRK